MILSAVSGESWRTVCTEPLPNVCAPMDVSVELRVATARQSASFLEDQTKSLRANLEQAQARLSKFQQTKGIVVTDERLDQENARYSALMVVTTSGTAMGPGEFWRRRIIRIVPLYWLLTLLMVAVALVAPGLFKTLKVAPATLVQSLLFIPHFSQSFPGIVWPLLVPGWTLNFEMFFYAVFGLALLLPERIRLLPLVTFFVILTAIGLAFGPFASAAAQTYTHPMLLEFAAGASIAAWWLSGRWRLPPATSWLLIGAGAVLLVVRDQEPFGTSMQIMAEIAASVSDVTGVRFRVVGFDTGAGLLPPSGPKDHPELWSAGDFAMQDPAELKRRLAGKAELVLGDIGDTIEPFVASLSADCPLGFVSVDVDVYSATVSALRGLRGSCDLYLPAVSFYFDDILFYFANEACGELAAIAEHNAAVPHRPIQSDRSLPGWRPDGYAPWYRAMYVAHILDHASRTTPRERRTLSLDEHLAFVGALR